MKKCIKIIFSVYIILALILGVVGFVFDILHTLCIITISPKALDIILTTFWLFFLPVIIYLFVHFIIKKAK